MTPRPSTEVAEDALAADDDDPSNFGAGILAGLRFEIPRQVNFHFEAGLQGRELAEMVEEGE